MRARVDDGVFGHGDSDAAHLVEVQAEVQNLHARIAAVVAQFLDFVGDDAEILGDDGKILDRLLHLFEERLAGTLAPAAVDRRLRLAVDLPVRLEAAEVVKPHDVDERAKLPEASLPPAVAVLLHRRPVVLRVAPQLSRRAEVVGRHARDRLRRAVLVEREQALVRPDVDAVVRDEDGHVAHDFDALLSRVVVQVFPLFVKQILPELLAADLVRQALSRRTKRGVLSLFQLGLPLEPRRFLVLNLQGLEERVVVKPGRLLIAEIPESVAFSLFLEVLPRTLQMLLLECPCPLIIDESRRTVGRRLHVTRCKQSVVDEHIERNEHGIARERRRRLIRRIAEITDGAQRQNLPDLLPGGGEEIDEAISVAAKIADAVLRRQRRRMKQDARFAREAPLLLHGLVDAPRKGRELHGQDAALNLHAFLPFNSFLQRSLQEITDIEHDLLLLCTTAVDNDDEGFVLRGCAELVRAASDRARIGEDVALARERQ